MIVKGILYKYSFKDLPFIVNLFILLFLRFIIISFLFSLNRIIRVKRFTKILIRQFKEEKKIYMCNTIISILMLNFFCLIIFLYLFNLAYFFRDFFILKFLKPLYYNSN